MLGIDDNILPTSSDPNSIGYNVVEQLALKGAKVFIGARSSEKAEGAITRLRKANPSIPAESLKPIVMDLNNLKQVNSVAQSFVKEQPRLDILVNNAGVCVLICPVLGTCERWLIRSATGWLALWTKNEHGISLSFNTKYARSAVSGTFEADCFSASYYLRLGPSLAIWVPSSLPSDSYLF